MIRSRHSRLWIGVLSLITCTAAVEGAVPAGFELDTLATVQRPTTIGFARSGSAFGADLYVGAFGSTPSEADTVFTVSAAGAVGRFATLVPNASPSGIAFPEPGGPYGDYLFLAANNRDFGQPFDCGGTVQRIDPAGNVIDFTLLTGCVSCSQAGIGLGEPSDVVFGNGGGFGTDLYVSNSSDRPADICNVATNGAIADFVQDGLCHPLGFAPVNLAFGSGGDFGTDLYFSDFGGECACIRIADSTGSVSAPFVAFSEHPTSIAFGSGGGFGFDLYAAVEDTIFRVTSDGVATPFASGFATGWFRLEFSPVDGALHVSSYGDDLVLRIRAASTDVAGRELDSKIILSSNFPNPFTSSTTFRYQLPEGVRDATIRIYGPGGRMIRELTDASRTGSSGRMTWDGRNVFGRPVPAGVYFYRLDADGARTEQSGKIMLVR